MSNPIQFAYGLFHHDDDWVVVSSPIIIFLIALWLKVVPQRDISLLRGRFQKSDAHWAIGLYHFEPRWITLILTIMIATIQWWRWWWWDAVPTREGHLSGTLLLLGSRAAPTLFSLRDIGLVIYRLSSLFLFFPHFFPLTNDSRFAFCLSSIGCSCYSWHGIKLVSTHIDTMTHIPIHVYWPHTLLLDNPIKQTTTCNPSWRWYS